MNRENVDVYCAFECVNGTKDWNNVRLIIEIRQNRNARLVVVVGIKALDTQVATMPHDVGHIVRSILGQHLHDPRLDGLGIKLALLIMLTQLLFEDAEKDLDGVVEWAVSWEKQDNDPSGPKVIDNDAVPVDFRAIHYPDGSVARVGLNEARVEDRFAGVEELFAGKSAFG